MSQEPCSHKEGLLERLRADIDQIDDQILSLLANRQEIAHKIGEYKKALGLQTLDLAREARIMERLVSQAGTPLSPAVVKSIFREIISAGRSLQVIPKVAFLGPKGSFSHEAASLFLGEHSDLFAASSPEAVFSLVEKGACHMGVVPVENSYQGSVAAILDLFYQYELKIQGEVFLRIRHHLLCKEQSKGDIHNIYSHPMAISQCKEWLRENMPDTTLVETQSTSEAAKKAAEQRGAAAIGSRLSAHLYGLHILEQDIEDRPDNVTRFLAIGREEMGPSGRDKTSIIFSLPHRAGALHRALGPLASHGINMTRIESRPAKTRKWEYLFFVDMEGHETDTHLAMALEEMEKQCSYFKSLGSYPKGDESWD